MLNCHNLITRKTNNSDSSLIDQYTRYKESSIIIHNCNSNKTNLTKIHLFYDVIHRKWWIILTYVAKLHTERAVLQKYLKKRIFKIFSKIFTIIIRWSSLIVKILKNVHWRMNLGVCCIIFYIRCTFMVFNLNFSRFWSAHDDKTSYLLRQWCFR